MKYLAQTVPEPGLSMISEMARSNIQTQDISHQLNEEHRSTLSEKLD